jgi:hypothetical protein
VVNTVNFFWGKLEAHFLHIAIVQPLNMHQEPHTLIGLRWDCQNGNQQAKNKFLHCGNQGLINKKIRHQRERKFANGKDSP